MERTRLPWFTEGVGRPFIGETSHEGGDEPHHHHEDGTTHDHEDGDEPHTHEEVELPDFKKMSKKALDEWAEERGIILDRRKTKAHMIAELNKQL